MQYTGRSILVFVVLVLNLAAAKDQWRTEVNIQGRALKGFAFKILLTTAPCVMSNANRKLPVKATTTTEKTRFAS